MAAASAHAHDSETAEVIAVNIIEVPQQTSLAQDLTFEEERVERQQELLDSARDIADDLDVGLRTRAIVGRNAGSAILDVIEEEDADHVLLGWKGTRSRREHVLGSTIDPVISRAPCDATLVKLGPAGGRGKGDIMILAGEGPHAPVAARRAREFAEASSEEPSLTLFNVQEPGDDEDGVSSQERGQALIEDFVARAGLEDLQFNSRIEVADDIEETILDAASEYDTICVGATQSGAVSQAVFGSLPETIGEQTDQTVVMARGPEESAMSVRQAIVRRLES